MNVQSQEALYLQQSNITSTHQIDTSQVELAHMYCYMCVPFPATLTSVYDVRKTYSQYQSAKDFLGCPAESLNPLQLVKGGNV